jgi:hypothetical protein
MGKKMRKVFGIIVTISLMIILASPAYAEDYLYGSNGTLYVVNCESYITLRNAPSTSAAEITKIPFGAAVGFYQAAENGFYEVKYFDHIGYALAAYLATTPQYRNASYYSIGAYPTMYVVNCRQSITLRDSPSTGATEICQIPLGAPVSFIDVSYNGFYKIIYNGHTGYSLAAYLVFQ